jgi:formate--tetrahydrofolate ligase
VEGVPVIVHGGPFANIAHGCNSVLATRMAMAHADWTITEAGFGFDLGAEKFFDIKCRSADLDTAAVVLVATVRALKLHGGADRNDLATPDPGAVERGIPNLEKHVENIHTFTEVPVVALNRFDTDTEEEIAVVRAACERLGVPFAVNDGFRSGGEGSVELARTVVEHAEKHSDPFHPLYDLADPFVTKLEKVARSMYGAAEVHLTAQAQKDFRQIERLGYGDLPVCMAKTPDSLSDDPKKKGRPEAFDITVRQIQIAAGAGFLIPLLGDIMRMPGLPREPQAVHMELRDGVIEGVH